MSKFISIGGKFAGVEKYEKKNNVISFYIKYKDLDNKTVREKVGEGSEGRPIFVYKNRDVIIDKHPKKQKIMLGYQTPNGVEWYTDDEALLVWKILLQNKATVGERLYEYHCEDFAF